MLRKQWFNYKHLTDLNTSSQLRTVLSQRKIGQGDLDLLNIFMQRRVRRNLRRRERVFRRRLNPLEFYDEREVKKLFRFERVHILRIAGELREMLKRPTGRNRALSPMQQLCIVLRYFATGCMQLSLGGVD